MKKIIRILLVILLITTICACKKEEDPMNISMNDVPITGGWQNNSEEFTVQLPNDSKEIFEKAVKDLNGVLYEPLLLLGTQVVAGRNLRYLCRTKAVVPNASYKFVVCTVYADLQGNCELTDTYDLDYVALKNETSDSENQEGLLGGYNLNKELDAGVLYESAQECFDAVTEGIMGHQFKALGVLGSQVVAGKNYAILTKVEVPAAENGDYLCILYLTHLANGENNQLVKYDINLAELSSK